jgi:hypothetical protein
MEPVRWRFLNHSRWIRIAIWLYIAQAILGVVVGLIIGTCIGLKVDTCLGFDFHGVASWLNF